MKNGIDISGATEIAEAFAEEFSNVYTIEPEGPLHQCPPVMHEETLEDILFTEHDIKSILQSLDRSAAAGPDMIPPIFLKECAQQIAPVLTELFRQSLDATYILTCRLETCDYYSNF